MNNTADKPYAPDLHGNERIRIEFVPHLLSTLYTLAESVLNISDLKMSKKIDRFTHETVEDVEGLREDDGEHTAVSAVLTKRCLMHVIYVLLHVVHFLTKISL